MTPARLGASLACAIPRPGTPTSDARTPHSIHIRSLINRSLLPNHIHIRVCPQASLNDDGYPSCGITFHELSILIGANGDRLPGVKRVAARRNVGKREVSLFVASASLVERGILSSIIGRNEDDRHGRNGFLIGAQHITCDTP